MSDTTATFVVIVLICGAAALAICLAFVPGWIARRRGHPSAQAIGICGVLGLLIWPLWLVAYIWAHTGPDRRAENTRGEPDYHLGLDRRPADPALAARSRRERRREG